MKSMVWLLLNEPTFTAALVIIVFLVILIWILLRKRVSTLPQLTLVLAPVTPPGQYEQGATVNVSGVSLEDVGPPSVPASGDTITLSLTDAKGTVFPVGGTITTAADGSYSGSFQVPNTAAPGAATLTATDTTTGATATATFTQKKSIQVSS
jgi:hypothetical protein